MARHAFRPSVSKFSLIATAAVLAALVTVAVAEMRPAGSNGTVAGMPSLILHPNRADVDFAHRAFERFQDRPDSRRETARALPAGKSAPVATSMVRF